MPTLSLFVPPPFFSFFFFAGLKLGQELARDESELESRQVCVTYNYFPRRAVQAACTEPADGSVGADESSDLSFHLCSVNLFTSDR